MKGTLAVTGGELLLDSLRTNQIKSIFYCPASEWVCLLAALAHYHNNSEPFPAYINCWHEDAAVVMPWGMRK